MISRASAAPESSLRCTMVENDNEMICIIGTTFDNALKVYVKSSIYARKKSGPKIDPRRTPAEIESHKDFYHSKQ